MNTSSVGSSLCLEPVIGNLGCRLSLFILSSLFLRRSRRDNAVGKEADTQPTRTRRRLHKSLSLVLVHVGNVRRNRLIMAVAGLSMLSKTVVCFKCFLGNYLDDIAIKVSVALV